MQQVSLNSRPQDAYKKQGVLTATPVELVVMLYDGLKKNMILGQRSIEKRNVQKAHDHLIKAQMIVTELMNSLDLNYGISDELLNLYEYILKTLEEANLSKDSEMIEPLIGMVDSLRGAWSEINESNKGNLHLEEG